MRAMKNSGLSWLGDIPADWELLYPKQLFQVRKERAREDDVMLTASQHLGMISQDEFMEAESYTPVAVEKGHDILKHVEPGDFVISMRSFQGGLEYSRVRGKMSSAYLALYSTDERVEDEYFKWLFKSDGYISSLQSTSNLVRDGQALRFANFIQVFLPLPPSSEQRAIAAYLDKACTGIDDAVQAAESSIGQYLNYRKSMIDIATTRGINDATGLIASGIDWLEKMPRTWRVATVGAIATETAAEPVEDARYIGLENVESFTSRFVGESSSVADMGDSVSYFDSDAVLLSKLRPYLAKACFPGFAGAASSEMLVLKTIPNISQRWFVYMLLNYRLVDQLNADTAGVRMPRTSWKAIKRHLIPIPPIEEQIAIAGYLDEKCAQIDAAIAAKRGIIDELKAYKKSLVYEYVTGKREVPCQ